MAADLLVNLRIRATNQVSGIANKIRQSLNGIARAQEKAQKSFQLAGNISLATQQIERFGAVARRAVAEPIQTFAEFEQQLANVASVSDGITDGAMKRLSDRAQELGATTRFTASQAAEGFKFLAIAGFDVEEQLKAIGPALDLATAGQVELGRASDIVSDILGSFRLSADQTNLAANVLTKTFTTSNTTLESLFETMKLAGPIATDLGADIKDVSAAVGVLGSAGIKGSQAGTRLTQVFTKLVKPTDTAKQILKELSVSTTDAQGNFRNLTDILGDISGGFDRLGVATAKRSEALAQLFDVRGAQAASILIANLDDVRKAREDLEDVTNDSTEASAVAAKQDATLAGAQRSLKSAAEGLAISLGKTLAPTFEAITRSVTSVIRRLTEWAQANPRLTKTIFAAVAGLAALLTVMGGVLTVIGTLLAAKGIIALAGGFAALTPILGGMTAAVVGLGKALLLMGAKAGAALAPLAVAAAPLLLVVSAATAATLAIRELAKAWDQLDFLEGLRGIGDAFGEDGFFSTVGQLFDPTALIESVTGGGGGETTVGGQIGINVQGPGQVTSVEQTGPIGLSVESGLATP